jgi:hypothetical protein
MTQPAHALDACCARIDAAALPLLAALRLHPAVRVRLRDPAAWVYWPAGDREVLYQVLAIGGAQLYEQRAGIWYRPGCRLPAFDVPAGGEALPLAGLLVPAAVAAQARAAPVQPVDLKLVRDSQPRPTRALCCRLAELAAWAEYATSRQLAGLQAAIDEVGQVLVLGETLPPLPTGTRFWGGRLLVPLGWRIEPDCGPEALCQAAGLGPDEMGLWTDAGVEALDRAAFRPLTRAGVRLAAGWGPARPSANLAF